MKSVSISEGGKGRIFPQTDKLKINNVGGGNSLWLPEEEVVTGTLYADENGIYLAENDGFSCYDTVVVRVEDETDPDEDDWELDLEEILDEEYEDIWDEESLEEFQEDPEAFEEKFNDKEKWKAEKAKKEKSQKIKKVKSLKPSKITGIDPVDGNPYQVGVDSEGNLTKEMLPSSIHIVVPPWKREYENGEEINFYGMHVYLLDKDGHPFKTEQYPTGEIPFEELLLPVTTAEGDGSEDGASRRSDGDGITVIELHGFIEEYGTDRICTGFGTINGVQIQFSNPTDNIIIYLTRYQNNIYTAGNGNGQNLGTLWLRNETISMSTLAIFYSKELTIHYAVSNNLWVFVPESTKDPRGIDPESLEEVGIEIPVQWMRSDGEMLEDKFIISVSNVENDMSWGNSTNPINNNESGHTSGGF